MKDLNINEIKKVQGGKCMCQCISLGGRRAPTAYEAISIETCKESCIAQQLGFSSCT